MPELPEVENMKMLLSKHCNIKINDIKIKNRSLRSPINSSFEDDIKSSEILEIKRLGKYLIFLLSNKKCIVMHAGMSGKFIATLTQDIAKHDHIIFYLANNVIIKYNDPRRFGIALSFNNETEALDSKLFKNIATDALDIKFNTDYLFQKIKHLKSPIKTTLLNQNIVSGIGNIYASEILYYAKIDPQKSCNLLTFNNISDIVKFTKEVLLNSIKLGGSTLKDYALPNGDTGYFQNNFAVYNKNDQKCNNCNHTINKIIMAGRATYFCPNEQK
ncbi:bifunctional DNA-formamidopyrimidine glycosylase/DNA-(apurinic or apyrimidinic site) lyase [Rickettsiales bacterium LUAb2]